MAYSGIYVFGDSLVDSGNALGLAEWYDGLPLTDLPEGAPTSELGYFRGRFSDGYTFTDLISNKAIGVVSRPVFPYRFEDPWLGVPIAPFASDPNGNNLNFAYGGAHIRQGDEVVPDLDDQTDAFRDAVDGDAPSGALYLVTTGGNDIRDLAPTGRDPVSQAEAYQELDACAQQLFHELSQLIDDGARNIVITGIPDVGSIPHYDRDGDGVLNATEQMRSDAATDYSIYLDTLIRTEVVPALQALGANVTYVPVMDYVDANGQLVTGALSAILPTIAASHGLTTEQLTANWLQYKELVFFDQVHPSAQAHALVGSYMQAMIAGTPWVETLPLTSSQVDYSLTASVSVAGEVDQLVIAMVAGTTYTFDLLGVSWLGATGSLADPSLRLLNSGGTLVAADDDSGAGFDATITFASASSANHTLQMFAFGSVTGTYTLQAAVISGTAMQAGNVYTVTNAATLVLEGAGGLGQDVVKTGVSYALNAGSEIEVLRTISDQGKGAINLTGNEFGQTLIGNGGNNVLDGKGGPDTLVGGGGKDVFVLGRDALTNPAAIDRISDYAKGEIVDVTQVLSVGTGTNIVGAGYLRVTTSGLIQVDLNGGGNDWVTLSSVNGNGAVTFRYLAGGTATTVSLSRTTSGQQLASNAAGTMMAGAVAAAGMAADYSPQLTGDGLDFTSMTVGRDAPVQPMTSFESAELRPVATFHREVAQAERAYEVASRAPADADRSTSSFDTTSALTAAALPPGPPHEANGEAAGSISLLARSVAMPSAEALGSLAIANVAEAKGPGEMPRLIAEALEQVGDVATIGAMLDILAPIESGAVPAASFVESAAQLMSLLADAGVGAFQLQADLIATV